MNKLRLTVLLLLTLSPAAYGQEQCDCTITPYKPNPPCWEKCTVQKILATATVEELQIVVGVNEKAARKIVAWDDRDDATSLKVYKEQNVLTGEQVKKLRKELKSLNKTQLSYFEKSPEERAKLQKEMELLLAPGSIKNTPEEVHQPGSSVTTAGVRPAPEVSPKEGAKKSKRRNIRRRRQ